MPNRMMNSCGLVGTLCGKVAATRACGCMAVSNPTFQDLIPCIVGAFVTCMFRGLFWNWNSPGQPNSQSPGAGLLNAGVGNRAVRCCCYPPNPSN